LIYGLPDSISLLYQLIGRAGRSGCQSLSVLYFSPSEEKKCIDHGLQLLCREKENCFHHTILQALGSDEVSSVVKEKCCNSCNLVCPYAELSFPSYRKKRQQRIHNVTSDMKKTLGTRLLKVVDDAVRRFPALKMLPRSLVCPASVIRLICEKSPYISSIQDLDTIPCLRRELKAKFYNIVANSLSNAPPSKHMCMHKM
jgi:hypothetical protein